MIPKTRWAQTVDGAQIAYQDFGSGPTTLVVIHGWISHLEVYWEQPRFVRFMRRLSAEMRVLHFDKRGSGMSDRFARVPDLETRMDDVRAVMDAAGVERAALLGWGLGGPPSALFFAATQPNRTMAVCTTPTILVRRVPGYGWGDDDVENERALEALVSAWGDEEQLGEFLRLGFENEPGDAPDDPAFLEWCAKFARFSATPRAYEAFHRMWYETDIRDVLSAIQIPTLIVYKSGSRNWASHDHGAYLAEQIPGAKLVGVAGSSPVMWIEEPTPVVSAIEQFLASVSTEEADLDRVLGTVLFTDIVGSTEKAALIGDRSWKQLVERHHQIMRALLRRYRGNEIDTAGDGFFAAFDGPARAVRCAQALVEAVKPLGLEVRAGVHSGEIETIDGKIGGIAVNIGARVGSIAGPSQLLVSQTVKDLVAGSGLVFEDAGEHQLKGVPDRWRIYRSVT
jgi:class 3 adenylate cyclase/pimeloyl-ACP methyl ester carboxylesterase